MQILGDLIRLPEHSSDIPLPWWHRASLGLLTHTTVYVGFSKAANRPAPDLIVSVLNPMEWDKMARFEIRENERPGLVHNIFEAIAPVDANEERAHNVALAESVTILDGRIHHGTIITELRGSVDRAINDVKRKLRTKGFTDVEAHPLMKDPPAIEKVSIGRVAQGWVRNVNWRDMLAECCPDAGDSVDLSRAVVSADTGHRLLRFVFPQKGTFALTIDHFDIPGALREILEVLAGQKLNILSALLRRGGAQPRMATLVAVCEPLDPSPKVTPDNMRETLRRIQPKYAVRLKAMTSGRFARDTLMPAQSSDILARPSEILTPIIESFRRGTSADRRQIFLSQRWGSDKASEKYSDMISEILSSCGGAIVEARPSQKKDPYSTGFTHVAAKMWMSEGGIVLLVKQSTAMTEISFNVAHELGFLQGQGKPVLLLMDNDLPAHFGDFANFRGAEVTRIDPNDYTSLRDTICKWMRETFEP